MKSSFAFIFLVIFLFLKGTLALATVWQVAAPADLLSIYNNADFVSGDVMELTSDGGAYTWSARVSPLTKSFTIQAINGLLNRPVITLPTGLCFIGYNITVPYSVTFNGVDFNGNGVSTGLTSTKAVPGGDLIVTMNNCIVRNLASAGIVFQYAATGTSWASWYSDLNVTNTQFIGPYATVNVVNAKYGGSANVNYTNCLFKNITGGVIGNLTNDGSNATVDHCTFDECASITGKYEVSFKAGGTPVNIVKNTIFANRGASTTANNLGSGNVSNTNNVVYYTGGGVVGTIYPSTLGSYSTTDPALNSTYHYATENSYLAAGSDGKSIGYAPVLTVNVATDDNMKTVPKNTTLQCSATVIDLLSPFSPAVTWSTNATNGSTIDATGLFTAGATDESGIVVTAATAYGYVGTTTVNVGEITDIDQFPNLSLSVYSTGKKIMVKMSKADHTGIITLYSILGQKIMSTQATGESTVLNVNLTTGIYLVSVNIAGKPTIKKIVIN